MLLHFAVAHGVGDPKDRHEMTYPTRVSGGLITEKSTSY